jgi:hypothetical protein
MMRVFDYAFYSLYNLYLTKEGKDSNPISSASSAILALKLSLFLGIMFFFLHLKPKDFHLFEYLGLDDYTSKGVAIVIGLLFLYVNYKSYKKRLPKIIKKYKNHPRNKWFRPWMLYFVALGFVLIPILIVKLLKAFS